ncbi:MAG: hypothetical protein JW830_11900 [Bacteroidales bacterium]|nr:hypothetical protein [Bacteroidales bacterium]
MKKLYLLSSLLLLILCTCSKDEITDPLLTGDALLKASHGRVFTVDPSGGDDTDNLIAAFEDAKAAGPGSIVLLAEGEFTIGFIEIHEFNGHFKGSGKSETIITNLEELPCGEAYDNNVLASLMKFIGGRVTIADMTFRIKDGRPCAFSESNETNMGDLFSILIVADYTDNYVPSNRTMKAVIENVDFIGGMDDGYGLWGTTHNTGIGVWCGPDFWWPLWDEPFGNGEYFVSGCNFDYFLDGVEGFGLGHHAIMKICNNTFRDCFYQLYFTANSGLKAFLMNNYFRDAWATDITLEDTWTDLVFPTVIPDYRTEFFVSGNVFDSPGGVTSLYIHDAMRIQTLNDDFAIQFNVKNNIFNTSEAGTAIVSSNNLFTRIWNNRFNGAGVAGVSVDGDATTGIYAKNVDLIGNNFFRADYTQADVYLGPFTQNCKVVGVASDNVIDEGLNNKVIGVKAHKNGLHSKALPNHFPGMHEKMMKMRSPK